MTVQSRQQRKTRMPEERKNANLEPEDQFAFSSKKPDSALQNLHESLAQPSAGLSLDPSLRSELEPQFGHSFQNVRIHADTNADQMAKSINANAFTTGQDVYFREGMFKPESSSGKELLAHELTHTIQQSRATSTAEAGIKISEPGDAFEQAAQNQASAVLAARGGAPIAQAEHSGVLIQREVHDPTESTATATTTTPAASDEHDGAPQAVTITSTAARAAFDRAVQDFEQGRFLEAARGFERLAEQYPSEQHDLLYNACRAYQRLGEGQNLGTRRIQHDVEVALGDPNLRQQAQNAMQDGVQAYHASDFARAAQLFRDAYRAVPTPEYQFNLGMALMRGRHPADALEAFDLAGRGGVHVPRRLLRRVEEERNRTGDISQSDLDTLGGSETDAIEAIVREASIDDAEVVYNTATRSFMAGNFDDASRQFGNAQALLTNSLGRADVQLLWNEARSRFEAGDLVNAVSMFRRSLSLD